MLFSFQTLIPKQQYNKSANLKAEKLNYCQSSSAVSSTVNVSATSRNTTQHNTALHCTALQASAFLLTDSHNSKLYLRSKKIKEYQKEQIIHVCYGTQPLTKRKSKAGFVGRWCTTVGALSLPSGGSAASVRPPVLKGSHTQVLLSTLGHTPTLPLSLVAATSVIINM